MIVKFICETPLEPWNRLFFQDQFRNDIAQHGITWKAGVIWDGNADLIISTPNMANKSCDNLAIWEWQESSVLSTATRAIMHRPEFRVVIKTNSYKTLTNHNFPGIPHITQDDLDKVELLTSLPYDQAIKPEEIHGKDIAVSLCASASQAFMQSEPPKPGYRTTHLPFYEEHRQYCFEAIAQLPADMCKAVLFGNVHGANTLYDYRDARRLYSRSYCVLSPFGVMPVSIRDFEAVCSGAVVIKPETDSRTNPNALEHAYFCKPNFSDLAEVIDKALSEFDYKFRLNLAYEMIDELRPQRLVDKMASIIRKHMP